MQLCLFWNVKIICGMQIGNRNNIKAFYNKTVFFFPVNNSLCRSIGTIGQETMFHTDSFMARSRCLFSLPSYLSLWLILFLLSLCITDTVNYGHTYGIKYPPLYAPLETRVFVQLKRGPARCYGAQGTTSRALQPARLELCQSLHIQMMNACSLHLQS